jgi:hypothetical protein
VYDALRQGRCYIAVDALAPATGFAFWADGPAGRAEMGAESQAGQRTFHVHAPRSARIHLLRDGAQIASQDGESLEHAAAEPGVYRVEAHLGDRPWVLSNPIYVR